MDRVSSKELVTGENSALKFLIPLLPLNEIPKKESSPFFTKLKYLKEESLKY